MKGAEKIFIHGEEIAKKKDLDKVVETTANIAYNESANVRNELNQRIDGIPVIYPQDLVDNGFDYSYEDTTQLSSVVVEVLPYGSGAGFTLQDDGYYHADNVGVDQSYAMAKIIFRNESDTVQQARLEIHQVAEQGCDYFVKSFLNTDLDDDINDSMNVEEWFNNEGSAWRTTVYNIPVGENYTIIKYRKDGSVSAVDELARFKVSAAYPVITELRHMATKEDSDWIKIEVETSLSKALNPSSNGANVNLKPEESKFEELIALVRKGIYKNIVLTDGIYTCFMCLDEVSEEEITYQSLYPIKNGARGLYYRALNFNFDETGVLTTLTISIRGNRILTTGETGSWTLDNYTPVYKKYVDDTINAVTDEKLAGAVPNDLLHYKGHVANVEQLPSLGQPTGVRGVNNLNAVIHNNSIIGTVKYEETFGITEPYYLVWRRYSQSVESTQPYLYLCCIETTNPEGISVVAFKKGAHTSNAADNVGNIGFYVKPTAEHPVYYRNSSYHYDVPLYMFKKNADGSWTRTSVQETEERVQLETDVEYIFSGYYNYGPLPLFGSTTASKNILLSTNIGKLKFKHIDLNSTSYVLYDSIKYGDSDYYYTDGMYIFETAGTGNKDQVKYVTNVTSTKLNDTYTVGDNYDIYRRNELPAWEHWSKATVTKEYVDKAIADAIAAITGE